MKTLSIIIVSWNVSALLIRLIKSIFEYTKDIDFEVIIVDNNSKDDTIEQLRSKFAEEIANEKLIILDEKENHGFAKGNNLGAARAKGEILWFLNPDMEFIEDSAKIMLEILKSDDKIGALGCKLLYEDRTAQPTVKSFPALPDQVLILLKLHHLLKTKSLKRYLAKYFRYDRQQAVDQLMGACLMINKEIFEKVGKWDEDYWLWWEDVDLCKKIKDAGYKNVFTPATAIIHYEGKSFEQVPSLDKQKRFNRGMRIYFRKHHGLGSYIFLSALSPVSLLLAWITQLFKVKPKTQSRI
ncbi:MAG: glycosyltransferase family 2 protein [Patescibacteria group bacterium]